MWTTSLENNLRKLWRLPPADRPLLEDPIAVLRRVTPDLKDGSRFDNVDELSRALVGSIEAGTSGPLDRAAMIPNWDELSIITVKHGYEPFALFGIAEALHGVPDWSGSHCRNALYALSALGAAENSFVASGFAASLAIQGHLERSKMWFVHALRQLGRRSCGHSVSPKEQVQTNATFATICEQMLDRLGTALTPRERVKYALLERLANFHIPDYRRLTTALTADSDRYGVPAYAWPALTHPAQADLVSDYLDLPIGSASVSDIPGGQKLEAFSANFQEMKIDGFFGGPFEYDAPKTVPYDAGIVHVVPNARFYVDTWKTAVWSETHGYLDELSHGPGVLPYAADRFNYLRPNLHSMQNMLGRTAIVSKRSAWEWYAHWITEVLPLVGMIWKVGLDFDHLVAFRSNAPYCQEGFEALGISQSKIIEGAEWVYGAAETAIVPRAALTMSGETPLSDFARGFVRDLFLLSPTDSKKTDRRIFVSRRNAKTRRLLNESEIANIFQMNGFEVVDLEDFSMVQKARLMNECEAVAGLYGAGLANLVFANPGTKVIEIRPHRSNWWIQHLCAGLKISYSCVAADIPIIPNYNQYTDVYCQPDFIFQALRHFQL